MEHNTDVELKKTALNSLHYSLGAKMVPFAGWDMPVQYAGVNVEHETVRNGVGVFDCSHMGEFFISGPGALPLIQKVCSNDAYPDGSLVKILGTKGTIYANRYNYKMKYFADCENEERPVIETPLKDENGLPIYCGEKLVTHEEEGTFDNGADTTSHTATGDTSTRCDLMSKRFYDGLYKTLTEGAPLPVPVEYAAHVISVIETAHAQNKMEVRF